MKEKKHKVRLFVEADLAQDAIVNLDEKQVHYLYNVMRTRKDSIINVFNGREGEWKAEVIQIDKQNCKIKVVTCAHTQAYCPKLTLLFAPIKNESANYIVQKATELGATDILPTLMQRSVVKTVNLAKLRLSAIEAAEQCDRLEIPYIDSILPLKDRLLNKTFTGRLLLCDETLTNKSLPKNISTTDNAILIGPEGGFAEEELSLLHSLDYVLPVSLGNLKLRSETAVIAALATYQTIIGNW